MNLVGLVIVVGVLRLLSAIERPFTCAAIYAGAYFVLDLLFGAGLVDALLSATVSLAYTWLWFWILVRTTSAIGWWAVTIGGFVLPTFLMLAIQTSTSG